MKEVSVIDRLRWATPGRISFVTAGCGLRIPQDSNAHYHWHPENSRVAAVLLMPEVTVSGVFVVPELVFSSDGVQSGVPVPSGVNAKASMV